MQIQNTKATNKRIMDLAGAVLFQTSLSTSEVHLYQNNFTPGLDTIVSDFTEATFDSYVKIVVAAWSATLIDPVTGDYYITNSTPLLFTDGGSTTPNTIYGWYMLDGPAGELLACQRFDTPVVMDALGKTILLTPRIFTGGFIGPDAYED